VGLGGRRRTGEQEATAGRVVINGTADNAEHRWHPLPFVNQQRRRVAPDDRSVGFDDLAFRGDVEVAERAALRVKVAVLPTALEPSSNTVGQLPE